jgi:hypothetical protein
VKANVTQFYQILLLLMEIIYIYIYIYHYSFLSIPDSPDPALIYEIPTSDFSVACSVPSSAGHAQVSMLSYEDHSFEALS